ncbi:hypothetical protein [Algoriphagus ratkowskyi]|nr:hypothetical protein [Algoriphagus ratkowskyi]TXD77383.1 hypothetical protein ESW18_11285 [Algoriphagus ratkowskyi]
MKSIRNLLPALGLVFGATLAMAMNFADPAVGKYHPTGQPDEWYDLTNVTPGPSTYQCNSSSEVCTFTEPDDQSASASMGIFQKNGSLPIL